MAPARPLQHRLVERYQHVRRITDALAAPLSPEDQQLQSMPGCSPTKWHRAHTTWFFEEFVLTPRGLPPVDARHRFLFNSYYEAVGARHPRPQRGLLSRPSSAEIASYRRVVDARMVELLLASDDRALTELAPLLDLGLAHEQQHQELLLTDILHAFAQNALRPVYTSAPEPPHASPAPLRFVEHEGGLVSLGTAPTDAFSFDNEGPRHRVWLEPFALASRPVSVGEVRAFIDAGGYRTPSLWLAEGLDWVRAHAIEAPLHTRVERGSYQVFTLHGEREAHDDEPAAHLSYYEADALARFLGARLPTEAEWETAVTGHDPAAGHFHGTLHPTVASAASPFGGVWVWTSSAYAPYPGFVASADAVGEYNGKFMVNQLVLRGGSCLTPPGHARATYRNFWHPDTRFQMTGARLARSLGRSERTRS